jgi:hypothetical protein
MAIIATGGKVHWNYFLALEQDMQSATRYVEFCDANMGTYSIEFAHLLLAASSEIDVVAKLLCQQIEPDAPRNNIDNYRAILAPQLSALSDLQVTVPRYGLTLSPWDNWASATNPYWWRSYNNVKHERDAYFQEATLGNSLNSLAGLLCLVFHLYDLDTRRTNPDARPKDTTYALQPESSLLRLHGDFYYEAYVG